METTDTKRKPGRPREEGLANRRKEEILDAATACFAQLGYRTTDIQLVANQLDVAKGTIYHYFPSKELLFLAAVDRGVRQLAAAVDGCVREVVEPLDRIRCAIREYLRFFSEHPQIVVLFIHERTEFRDRKRTTYFEHQNRRMVAWHQLLDSLIAEGRCREVPVERIANVVNDVLYGTIFANYFTGRATSFERQAEDILDVVFHGILSNDERARRMTPTLSANAETSML